jgi:hypothetical protein
MSLAADVYDAASVKHHDALSSISAPPTFFIIGCREV